MVWATLFLIGGLLLLWRGADFLVGGAVGLAERMGVSQLVAGLTIVAMGTSAPEVAAAVTAAVGGKGDLAIGNVYGSNIANLAMIGGIVAMIRPLEVRAATLRREIPAMLAITLLLWPVLADRAVSRFDATILLLIFTGLVLHTVRTAGTTRTGASTEPVPTTTIEPPRTVGRDILAIALGLAALAIGAKGAVSGAVTLGTRAGLSDAVIGSTIIAVGTSLPELVTCIVASIKGRHDISVGNLVGSNIFNVLFVTGIAGLVHPFGVTSRFAGGVDFWIMTVIGGLFAAAAILGKRAIRRSGGGVLLAMYIAYLVYLLRSAGPT
ncbi:MAG TPA: calcium/sodium antiporter [Sedimentisphaerales bacterium]|nr:calcium/sodium antiporter [Sedimentisphaerales bacterium]